MTDTRLPLSTEDRRLNRVILEDMLDGVDLAAHRNSNGWSQDDVARALGVQQSTYGHWENGTVLPCLEHLRLLRMEFDLPLPADDRDANALLLQKALGGNDLRTFRRARDMTGRELGALVGVAKCSHWERGIHLPTGDCLRKLRRMIVGGAMPKAPPPQPERPQQAPLPMTPLRDVSFRRETPGEVPLPRTALPDVKWRIARESERAVEEAVERASALVADGAPQRPPVEATPAPRRESTAAAGGLLDRSTALEILVRLTALLADYECASPEVAKMPVGQHARAALDLLQERLR